MLKSFLSTVILTALIGGAIWVFFFRTPTTQPQTAVDQTPSTATGTRNVDMVRQGTTTTARANVTAALVGYHGTVKGWYAEPIATGTYPGVIMVHEWWGLNDHIKSMAEELASEGYRVLAVDLYGRVATTSEDARRFSQYVTTGVNGQKDALDNMKAASTFLKREGSYTIGVLGWCFGGGQALRLALADSDIDATVIYYGQLVTDASQLKTLKSPVLGIFGDKDTSISTTSVKTFDTYLDVNKIANEIYMYAGVGHAFANPSGANHAPAETKDAWAKTLAFLKNHLAVGGTR